MKNNKLTKIAVGKEGNGIARFDLSHDVNTTMEFGDVEPMFIHEMAANSKMSFKHENLTRLAVLNAPCFGRMKYHNFNLFVKKSDLFPYYDSWLSQKPVTNTMGTSYVPIRLPHISANKLFANCFVGAQQSGFQWTKPVGSLVDDPYLVTEWTQTDASGWRAWLANTVFTGSAASTPWLPAVPNYASGVDQLNLAWFIGQLPNSSSSNIVPAPSGTQLVDVMASSDYPTWNAVPIVSSDYTIYTHNQLNAGGSWASASKFFAHSFRWSNYGRRFAKILRACGYPLDNTSDYEVSILPLMAYYRAYFELYGLSLYKNWEETPCYALIQHFRVGLPNDDSNDLNAMWFDNTSILWKFIRDLSNCWVTDEQDVISGMTKEATGIGNALPSFTTIGSFLNFLQLGSARFNSDGSVNYDRAFGEILGLSYNPLDKNSVGDWTESIKTGDVKHNELTAQLLKSAYKFVNRDTIIGHNIAKALDVLGYERYDEDVPCPFIGHTSYSLNVSDVTSLADTSEAGSNTGRALGEFGGKCVGYNSSDKLTWKADQDGYWISFSAIIPEGGYCQQLDRTLQNIDKWSAYNAEFDGKGMVAFDKSFVVGSPYSGKAMFDQTRDRMDSLCQLKFGYAPRMTEYKIARNVANGDVIRNATRDTYGSYHLDKLIVVGVPELEYDELTHTYRGKVGSVLNPAKLPMAGLSWRFGSRYKWLSNYDRIFANIGLDSKTSAGVKYLNWLLMSGETEGYSMDCLTYNDDNFLSHSVNIVPYNAPMKPIGECYGTFDDDKGANASVTKQ